MDEDELELSAEAEKVCHVVLAFLESEFASASASDVATALAGASGRVVGRAATSPAARVAAAETLGALLAVESERESGARERLRREQEEREDRANRLDAAMARARGES